MEAVALFNLVLIGVLAWKAMAIKDHIEGLESQRKYLETKIDKISKDLDLIIKGVQPVEIPARLPEETLKEVIPGLFKEKKNFIDDTFDHMAKEDAKKKESMPFFHRMSSEDIRRDDAPNPEVDYQGTENGGPARLTYEQAQEILSNISKRRKYKLK